MRLPEICIKRPVLTLMMNAILVLFGIVGLSKLSVRELPDIDPPIVTVTTVYPGANAEVVETEITERLEEAIGGIEAIKVIESESKEEVSNVTIEFDLSRSIDLAAQDVRDRVSRIRGSLPDEVEDPVVAKADSDARPILWVALFSESFSTQELTDLAEREIQDRLETVSGVSSVILGGSKRYAIRIWLDPVRMAARGVTALDVEQALREESVELPSGRIENLKREFTIQTLGELKTPEQFNRLIIKNTENGAIRLEDLGEAKAGVEDERTIARYKSKPAMGLGIVRQTQANIIEVAKGIKAEIKKIQPTLPPGVQTFIAYDESVYVERAIQEVWITLFIALLLVVFVIFIFLQDIRTTLIPAVTIPVSIISTFAVLYFFGFSINILTMLSLILAIGIVVDDAIVVLENIYRHIQEGEKPFQAAFKAMEEISFAVIATTVALLAVFVPLAFQTTITGRLFIEFAVALCGSVAISTFVALTLVPSLTPRLLSRESTAKKAEFLIKFDRWIHELTGKYLASLKWALSHRKLMLSYAAISLVASIIFYRILDHEFLPAEDKGRLFSVAIAPEGSTSEYTDKQVRKMEKIVSEIPEVEAGGYFSAVALSRGGPGASNQGLMFIRFTDDRVRSVQDIVAGPRGIGARFFGDVTGAFAFPIVPKAIESGFSQPFKLIIQNPDLKKLDSFSQQLIGELHKKGFLQNVRATFEITKPEAELEIIREKASDLGISVLDISKTLQILMGGKDISSVKLKGKVYDVIAQIPRAERLTPKTFDAIHMRTAAGDLVPLSSLVRISERAGPNVINRYNRKRSATIEGTPLVPLGSAISQVEDTLTEILPEGFSFEWAGEAEDLKSASKNILFIVVLAILITYMVLAAQFESFIHPLTVLLALPLALVGAFGLLYALSLVNALGSGMYGWANYSPDPPGIAKFLSSIIPRIPAMNINLFSQVGLVLLIGLVTKNSILLVEFANQKVADGKSAVEAMLESGRIRFRPILMTAVSTIAGILPIAIGFGAGAESRRPMGVAILGGVTTSTFLTLFVIPVVYCIFSELSGRPSSKTKLQ